jgi:signal transduction histidine kinase
MFWHGGFPLFVIAYALPEDEARDATLLRSRSRGTILAAVAAVLSFVCALTVFATAGQDLLPVIMLGDRYAPSMIGVVSGVWLLSLLALVVLWRRKPPTVLDLWLMVVMCVWLFEIALSAVINAGPFDLGFYAGRIYGLLAATFVLMVLLIESSMLYARLARAHAVERRERDRLQERSAELTAANQELESFSYSVSHDLRAPLRAMAGYAAIIEEDHGSQLDEEGRRLLGMVRERSRSMDALISDLLAFSRLGRQPITAVRVDMDTLVAAIVQELKSSEDGARTQFDVAPLPQAWGDRALLRQAWVNLLSNAVKFSRTCAGPKIEVGFTARGAQAIYWVKDNGVGFDMEYYDKLFATFQRLHSTREFPGSGVGLAIVERIVTRHDGHVWAESKPGAGATFYFMVSPEPAAGAAAAT